MLATTTAPIRRGLQSVVHVRNGNPRRNSRQPASGDLKPSLVIETFEGDWEKEWFTYKPEDWARQTHKVYDEQWKAPTGAKLAFEVRSARRNKLVVGIDQYAAEVQLEGNSAWHPVN